MRRLQNHAVAVLIAAFLVALSAGCSGGSGGTDGTVSGATDTIRVAVRHGKVTPPTHREQVAEGDTVRLVVTTDTADEVHVHGVNIEKETEPGKPVTIEFIAREPGIYEVETHESDMQLVQIEVR